MRIWLIVLLGMACGCGVGVATSWARYGNVSAATAPSGDVGDVIGDLKRLPADQPQPRVSVEHDEFDFGELQLGTETEHLFRIANTGEAPLNVRSGGTTCAKCTLYSLDKENLEPGESEDVKVSYRASSLGVFRQTATILTNDALRPRVTLVVRGKVVTMVRVSPPDLVFSRLIADEPATADLRVLCYSRVPLEIRGHEFLEGETAERFKLEIEPLPQADLDKEDAHSGVRLRVTALAGLPVGAVRQKLRLKTNQEVSPTLDISIQGRVDSDISVIGSGWDGNTGVLAIGLVKGREGARRQLFLLVRGPHRHEVEFRQESREPEWLQVELGEPQDVNQGAIVKIPLTVVIPPGSPAANHVGSVQGKLGHLVLKTTHPTAKEVRLYVQFFVEN